MSTTETTAGLAAFLERHGDRSPEVIWEAALALIRDAVAHVGEGGSRQRWRAYPRGELRRLRRDIVDGLELARLAVAMHEEYREQTRPLDEFLHAQAAEADRRRRREQTLPAERARLAKAALRREAQAG